ncbi:WD40 repeat-like protein [Coniophora puteana RWD-64-598 SS2]|uniref:WD40 repeat-like protein n=1 Tax=Coniophora puteana (strain RWD-64-598) TaxID=741705 RepID=A0A5M3MJV6_CONPW|nr:WD40 repeat-like protein [Coniophora puteana RWD-64-598 SS2]EIW79492.1 WD40 repeat-like protein [Coniophora puteana RWD-64-598 SS2]
MASTSTAPPAGPTHPVIFTTKTQYVLPSQKFMVPLAWRRYHLSQLVNRALSLPSPVPFDFLVQGEILRGTLQEWMVERGVGPEETLEVEYVESVLPPTKAAERKSEDWEAGVTCAVPGHFATASYDGHIRVFDYAHFQTAKHTARIHPAPITSLHVVPLQSTSSDEEQTYTILTSSHDLTARLSTLSLSPNSPKPTTTKTLASLHLHTAPVSHVTVSQDGSTVLTSSWDTLIGVWDTRIPPSDEVPDDAPDGERKKRRKLAKSGEEEKVVRKVPTAVLKSHTNRVSAAAFLPGSNEKAASVGFDATVRTWDVENGLCTHTITAPEKPFLALAMHSTNNAFAASTDRNVSLFDLRSAASAPLLSLPHPATPSCLALPLAAASHPGNPDNGGGGNENQLISGAYDGVVRLWDVRSTRVALASMRMWEAGDKVLSVDWRGEVVAVAGEGGVGVWRVGRQ